MYHAQQCKYVQSYCGYTFVWWNLWVNQNAPLTIDQFLYLHYLMPDKNHYCRQLWVFTQTLMSSSDFAVIYHIWNYRAQQKFKWLGPGRFSLAFIGHNQYAESYLRSKLQKLSSIICPFCWEDIFYSSEFQIQERIIQRVWRLRKISFINYKSFD